MAVKLTPRELNVLGLLCDGLSNRDIASSIGTTERVIKNYLFVIFNKVGVDSRLELLVYVIRHPEIEKAALASVAEMKKCKRSSRRKQCDS